MSRHIFTIPERSNIEYVVGWDTLLRSYFAQIFSTNPAPKTLGYNALFNVGCDFGQSIHSVEELQAQVPEDFIIPKDLRIQLVQDRLSEISRTPLQQQVTKFLGNAKRL